MAARNRSAGNRRRGEEHRNIGRVNDSSTDDEDWLQRRDKRTKKPSPKFVDAVAAAPLRPGLRLRPPAPNCATVTQQLQKPVASVLKSSRPPAAPKDDIRRRRRRIDQIIAENFTAVKGWISPHRQHVLIKSENGEMETFKSEKLPPPLVLVTPTPEPTLLVINNTSFQHDFHDIVNNDADGLPEQNGFGWRNADVLIKVPLLILIGYVAFLLVFGALLEIYG